MEHITADTNFIKIEKLKELIQGTPDVILDLVGAMKFTPQKGRYESGSFNDADENSKRSTGVALATGGKDRMLAIAELHQAFPDAQLITMSKTRSEDPIVPTYAAMTRDELIRKGVPAESIMLEEDSVSTITEYSEAAKLWQKYHWKNIVFVTSNWHIPRSEALFNHIRNLVEPEDAVLIDSFITAIQLNELRVQFIGSTDVLSIKSDKYKHFFEALDEDPGMLARVAAEEKALLQIVSGDYGGKILNIDDKIWSTKI